MGSYVEKISSTSLASVLGKTPRLGHLDIELTERCNNDCIHCCISRGAQDAEVRARELTGAQVMRILDEAAGLGALSVRFTGGEPLLREDFAGVYAHARRLGLKVVVFTNARLVTEDLAALFARIPPLLPIEISVYGMQAASYEVVARSPGAFAELRRGVERLRARGVAFVLKGVVLPHTRPELDEFRQWASAVSGRADPPELVALLDLRHRRDSEERNQLIQALRLSPPEFLAVKRQAGGDDAREQRRFCARFMGARGPRLFACGAGQGIAVDAYGRLQPCLALRAPELTYDLLGGTLAEALRGFFPGVRMLEAKNPAYLQRCARCFLKGLCEQCPAKSWSEHGTLDTPVEYLCEIAHAEARALGLLQAGEKSWEVVDPAPRLARLVGP